MYAYLYATSSNGLFSMSDTFVDYIGVGPVTGICIFLHPFLSLVRAIYNGSIFGCLGNVVVLLGALKYQCDNFGKGLMVRMVVFVYYMLYLLCGVPMSSQTHELGLGFQAKLIQIANTIF